MLACLVVCPAAIRIFKDRLHAVVAFFEVFVSLSLKTNDNGHFRTGKDLTVNMLLQILKVYSQ